MNRMPPLQITLHRMRQNDRCCRSRHAMRTHSKMRPHKKHPAQCSRKCMQRPRQRPSLPDGVLRRPFRAVECWRRLFWPGALRPVSCTRCAMRRSWNGCVLIFRAGLRFFGFRYPRGGSNLYGRIHHPVGRGDLPVPAGLFRFWAGADRSVHDALWGRERHPDGPAFSGTSLGGKALLLCLPQFRHLRRRPACAFWARQLCVSAAASGHTLSGRCIPVRNARARQCYSASTC